MGWRIALLPFTTTMPVLSWPHLASRFLSLLASPGLSWPFLACNGISWPLLASRYVCGELLVLLLLLLLLQRLLLWLLLLLLLLL